MKLIKHQSNVHELALDEDQSQIAMLSDIHWDNPKCDWKLLKKHLDYCKDHNIPVMINEYLLSKHAVWFWIMMVLSIGAIISVFVINEENTPLIFIRYVLGVLFILFLPGYSLVKALFPTREIDYLERTVLSMGISISLVPVVVMILNYTPWGIRLIPVSLFLLILTTTFTVIALIREFSLVRNQKETYGT